MSPRCSIANAISPANLEQPKTTEERADMRLSMYQEASARADGMDLRIATNNTQVYSVVKGELVVPYNAAEREAAYKSGAQLVNIRGMCRLPAPECCSHRQEPYHTKVFQLKGKGKAADEYVLVPATHTSVNFHNMLMPWLLSLQNAMIMCRNENDSACAQHITIDAKDDGKTRTSTHCFPLSAFTQNEQIAANLGRRWMEDPEQRAVAEAALTHKKPGVVCIFSFSEPSSKWDDTPSTDSEGEPNKKLLYSVDHPDAVGLSIRTYKYDSGAICSHILCEVYAAERRSNREIHECARPLPPSDTLPPPLSLQASLIEGVDYRQGLYV